MGRGVKQGKALPCAWAQRARTVRCVQAQAQRVAAFGLQPCLRDESHH